MCAFGSRRFVTADTHAGLTNQTARRYTLRPLASAFVADRQRRKDVRHRGCFAVVNAAAARAEQASESTLQPALRECVTRAVRRYLHDLDSQAPDGLYELVLREVEAPLLREVLSWAGGNQSKAASALGINRATLRKKLASLHLG